MSTNMWHERLEAAEKYYREWESRFKCKILEDYYRGFQWKQRRDFVPTSNYNPYTINLFYSTIKIKLAGLLFQKPKFVISPNPGNSNWNIDLAVRSAQLKEDVLNTIVRNPNTNFTRHIKRAARDSFTRFGVVEVGYAADFKNPQKVDPLLKSWEDEDVDDDKDRVNDDNPISINERFYVKRIHPTRFRVAVSEAMDLNDHDWFGYYEYVYTKTLQNTEGIKWPENTVGGSFVSAEYASGFVGDQSKNSDYIRNLYSRGEISRIWHIWDNVAKKRKLLLDDSEMSELWNERFEHVPVIDIRWDEDERGFYPIPPAFHWISPQDEINEAREQTRSYRRRFTRKFQAVKGAVDEEEKEKFASGPDGIIIEVKQANAISSIDNPEIGPTSENALIIAKDDFNLISGTSAEARGQNSDRQTATSAKIVDIRSQIRESAEQLDFSGFLCRIGRELLTTCQERLAEGIWVKYTTSVGGSQVDAPVFQWISSQQIDDGFDYEVEFDVQNATPAAMQAAQQSFVNFLALLQNFPMIMMDPELIREAAYRVGYRNEQMIKKAQNIAIAQAQMQAQQIANSPLGQAQGGGANAAKTQAAQMQTPGLDTIQNQITNQLM